MANIMRIGGGTGGGELNIFCQTAKPDKPNGLWIKNDNVDNVLIKSDYYLEDGTAAIVKNDLDRAVFSGFSGTVGSVIYCFGGKYTNGYYGSVSIYTTDKNSGGRAYDTATNMWSNITYSPPITTTSAFEAGIPWEGMVKDGIIYIPILNTSTSTYNGNNVYIQMYDAATGVMTNVNCPMRTYYSNEKASIKGTKLVGDVIYMLTYSNSSGSGAYYMEMWAYDIVNKVVTKKFTWDYARGSTGGFVGLNGTVLECFDYKMALITRYDMETNIGSVTNSTTRLVAYTGSNANSSYGGAGFLQLFDKVYCIGGMGSAASAAADNSANKSVSIYNLATGSVTGKGEVLPQTYSGFTLFPFTGFVDGVFYLIGGYNYGSGSGYTNYMLYHTVCKYAIDTHEFDNGTVVCDPSATVNITEMYSDKSTTLHFGFDNIYLQSAEGFKSQPAAILKNGVAYNIN